MKSTNLLAAALIMALCTSMSAQTSSSGGMPWLAYKPDATNPPSTAIVDTLPGPAPQQIAAQPTPQSLAVSQEDHPEIVALAAALNNDAVRIFNHVHDHIEYSCYPGMAKGAVLTLLEGSGNDYDQSALLVALLRAAGHNDVSFQKGWMVMPYTAAVADNDLCKWLGLPVEPSPGQTYQQAFGQPNPYSGTTELQGKRLRMAQMYFARFGVESNPWQDLGSLSVQRVWVKFGTVNLDPAYKHYEKIPGINLATLANYNRSSMVNGVSTVESDSSSYRKLNDAQLKARLGTMTGEVLTKLKNQYWNLEVSEITGGRKIVPSGLENFGSYVFSSNTVSIPETVLQIPDSEKLSIRFTINGTVIVNQKFCDLAGARLSLVANGNQVKLMLDDAMLGNPQTVTGEEYTFGMDVNFPGAGTPSPITAKYKKNNNFMYAIVYAFEASGRLLQQRYDKLKAYQDAGKADDSPEVRCESLNIIGLNWMFQTNLMLRVFSATSSVVVVPQYRVGRVAQESGFYIDVSCQATSQYSLKGSESDEELFFQLPSLVMSAMEHSVIEQIQPGPMAMSTVNILRKANDEGISIFAPSELSWSNGFRSYYSFLNTSNTERDALDQLDEFFNYGIVGPLPNGKIALMPASSVSEGSWSGMGYLIRKRDVSGMIINGGFSLNGGYSTLPSWVAPTGLISSFFASPGSQRNCGTIPTSFTTISSAAYNASRALSADPIDMASGAFIYGSEDMTTGNETAPRGLTFSRSYSSLRHDSNEHFLGPGWTHNLDIRAKVRTAAEESLSLGTPSQCASLLVAIPVMVDLFRESASPKEWGMAVHTAGWLVDNITNNAVSLRVGSHTMQFVKMPDGSFVAPAGSTSTLTKPDGAYELKERLGNTIRFDVKGRAATITDPDSKELTFAYLEDTRASKIDYVQDCYGRRYTFGYTGDKITSVDDSTGRSIAFGYDAKSNLVSATDPEGKTTKFDYKLAGDSDSMLALSYIRRIRDRTGATVVETDYDSLGRAWRQRTHGDAAKTTILRYAGYRTDEVDPMNGVTSHFFDSRGRSSGLRDPDGFYSSWRYDGRDQVVSTTNGAGETTDYLIDSNLNLKQVNHPRGGGSTFYDYDSLHRPTATTDPDGRTVTKEYNPGNLKNRPDRVVDAQGITSILYYGSGPGIGNPSTITEPLQSLKTEYGYNSYGDRLWKKQRTFTWNYASNPRGDLTQVTNPNGVLSITDYNLRRQPTSITADSSGQDPATETIVYDNEGREAGQIAAADNDNQKVKTRTEYNSTGKPRFVRHTDENGEGSDDPYEELVYDNRDWQVSRYDLARRLSSITPTSGGALYQTSMPLGRVVTRSQDGMGRTLSESSPGAPTTRTVTSGFSVSGPGDATSGYPKTTLVTADSLTSVSEFNRSGQIRFQRDRRGNSWEFRYDDMARLSHVIRPADAAAGVAFRTEYNTQGDVGKITEPSGQATDYTYHPTTGRTASVSDGIGTTSFTGYDNNGNVLSMSQVRAGTSYSISKTWDSHDRIRSRTDESQTTVGYRYYASGKLRRLIYPGGNDVTGLGCVDYIYWKSGRLKKVIDRLDSATSPRITSYVWYPDGRLKQIDRPNLTRRTVTYDAAGRPDTITESAILTDTLIHLQKLTYYGSDEAKTRYTLPSFSNGTTFPPPALTGLAYDASNQLTTCPGGTVSNDTDGNMTQGPVLPLGAPALEFRPHAYDSRNRLTAVGPIGSPGRVERAYDSENQRTSVSHQGVTSTLVNDSSGLSKLLQRTKGGVTTRYVWGIGLAYEVDPAGTATTYHYDATGSTVALTDPAGYVKERLDYSPYGVLLRRWSASGSNQDTPFLYTGMLGNQTDPDGLIYMRARYYSPLLGRFLSGDPAREGSNWYGYAGGNPIGNVDPTGLGVDRALDVIQTTLNYVGLVPGAGIFANAMNAAISVGRGNYGEAALYTASAFSGGLLGAGAGLAVRGELSLSRTFMTGGGSLSRPAMNIGSGVPAVNNAARTNFSVYETLAEVPISGATRGGHRGVANTAFARQLEGSAELQGRFNQLFGKDVLAHMNSGAGSKLINPPGAVWHHPIDNPNVLQLLRRPEHTNPLLQPLLHPGPNRTGGFGTHFGGN